MNKARRKAIEDIMAQVEDIKSNVDDILSEEEEYRDNIPENLHGSENYERADEAVSNLESASSYLDDVMASLEAAAE